MATTSERTPALDCRLLAAYVPHHFYLVRFAVLWFLKAHLVETGGGLVPRTPELLAASL